MATIANPTQPEERAGWEIDQEAFAPPSTRRIIRGWDRAQVSAHAPRLHGQKVWKKFRTLPGKAEDDGDEAQDELEKEGAGQRKKARPMGAKENITDAAWSALKPHVEEVSDSRPSFGTCSMPSILADVTNLQMTSIPTKASTASTMPELHFVPRKRTNTNHVITPKKSMRQTTLNKQAQRQSLLEPLKNGSSKRPRKSMRKSMRMSSVGILAEQPITMPHSQTFTGIEVQNNQESVQVREIDHIHNAAENIPRRKSVRQSTRSTRVSAVQAEQMLGSGTTAGDDGEDAPELIVEAVPYQNPEVVEEKLTVFMDGAESTGTQIAPESTTTELQHETPGSEIQNLDSGSADSSLSSIDSGVFDDITLSHQEVKFNITQDAQNDDQLNITKAVITSISNVSPDPELSSDSAPEPAENIDEFFINVSKISSQQAIAPQGSDQVFEIGTESAEAAQAEANLATEADVEDSFTLGPVVSIPEAVNEIQSEKPTNPDTADSSTTVGSTYDHDDTDMLLNFLTRVKANKAAKKASPKRKRSLPHSPLRIPLGDMDSNLSPLSLQQEGEFDLTPVSPSKRKKRGTSLTTEDEIEEPKSCRRSTRTRLPVKSGALPAAPSLIPMRRLGQEDTTVTLKRSEEKELAALTRVNTRKNKGGSLPALEVLARRVEEKDDPVMRQRLLKEVFDAKIEKGKEKRGKGKAVTWAEELAQFQTLTKGKLELKKEDKEKEKSAQVGEEKKQGAVRVGVRSKMALGMAANGTPAPKRKVKGRV